MEVETIGSTTISNFKVCYIGLREDICAARYAFNIKVRSFFNRYVNLITKFFDNGSDALRVIHMRRTCIL